ncbi:MAG: CoA-binding protein [Chloroflexi bacterium]|nr:CoA-binding protein [Chloroflexota bacterium]
MLPQRLRVSEFSLEELIVNLLKNSKNIAVVGLSDDSMRPSYEVAAYMQSQGYRIIPVNPYVTQVLGVEANPNLTANPANKRDDIVDDFLRPEYTPDVVREALARGVESIWLQLGITNETARKLAEDAEVPYVQNRCLLIEHRKYRRLLT